MGFKQVFDDLIVKHLNALRKQIQFLANYVLNRCFWTYATLKELSAYKQLSIKAVLNFR